MSNEVIWILVAGLVALAAWYFWPKADVNKDGKVDGADLADAAKKVADVNKDGKVNTDDVKVVAAKVKTTAKAAGTKAKAAVKKTASKSK